MPLTREVLPHPDGALIIKIFGIYPVKLENIVYHKFDRRGKWVIHGSQLHLRVYKHM